MPQSPVINRAIDELQLPADLGIREIGVEDVKINAMIYADPGIGKTTFVESANRHPALRPVLFFNLEGGLLSVAHRRPNSIDIESTDHFETLLHLYAQGDPRLRRFPTIAMDSASELQRGSLQEHIIRRAGSRSGRSSINDIDRDDYGRMTVQLGRTLSMMRDLPCHTLITAHPRALDNDGVVSSVFPGFTPRLATQVMGFFDFVWYMYMTVDEDGSTERRYLLTRDRGPYKAKTRGPRFRDMLGERFEIGNDGAPMLPEIYEMLLHTQRMHPGDQDSEISPEQWVETYTRNTPRAPATGGLIERAGRPVAPNMPSRGRPVQVTPVGHTHVTSAEIGEAPVQVSAPNERIFNAPYATNVETGETLLVQSRPPGSSYVEQMGDNFRVVDVPGNDGDEESDMYEVNTTGATPEPSPEATPPGGAIRPPGATGTPPSLPGAPRMTVRAPAQRPSPTRNAMNAARQAATAVQPTPRPGQNS